MHCKCICADNARPFGTKEANSYVPYYIALHTSIYTYALHCVAYKAEFLKTFFLCFSIIYSFRLNLRFFFYHISDLLKRHQQSDREVLLYIYYIFYMREIGVYYYLYCTINALS